MDYDIWALYPGRMAKLTGLQRMIQPPIQRTCGILWTSALLFFVAQFLALGRPGVTFADISFLSLFPWNAAYRADCDELRALVEH